MVILWAYNMGECLSRLAGVKTLTRSTRLCDSASRGQCYTSCILLTGPTFLSIFLPSFLIFLLQLLHIMLSFFFCLTVCVSFFPIYVCKCMYMSELIQKEMSETEADAKETALFIYSLSFDVCVHDILYVLWSGLPDIYLVKNKMSYFNVWNFR